MLSDLDFEAVAAQASLARFGRIRTVSGTYDLPALSPGIRTEQDGHALVENIHQGLDVPVVTPYVSWQDRYGGVVYDVLGLEVPSGVVVYPRSLVVPDIEAEAFSFDCNARRRYLHRGQVPEPVQPLLRCGLRPNAATGQPDVHRAWDRLVANRGLTSLTKWARVQYTRVGSEIFFAFGPILRANASRVGHALEIHDAMLGIVMGSAGFRRHGIHFLLHGELFAPEPRAEAARERIYEELDRWATVPRFADHQRVWVSLKIHDPLRELEDAQVGGGRRKVLSEFVGEVAWRLRRTKGALVVHNMGAWGLGMLESGADIATFRATGPMRIDTPMRGSPGGQRPVGLFYHTSLREHPLSEVKALYSQTTAFPVPECVTPAPYWTRRRQDQVLYAARVKIGALTELGHHYRDAGTNVNSGIPLADAVRDRVLRSEIRQELLDLCPSIAGTI